MPEITPFVSHRALAAPWAARAVRPGSAALGPMEKPMSPALLDVLADLVVPTVRALGRRRPACPGPESRPDAGGKGRLMGRWRTRVMPARQAGSDRSGGTPSG